MKKVWRKAVACTLALALATVGGSLNPVADLLRGMAVTASAEGAVSLKKDGDVYYVNMSKTGADTLTLTDASVTTFKVYDNGGKDRNYDDDCNSYLTLTAPEGYVLKLSGIIETDYRYSDPDNLTVYDGTGTTDPKLLDRVSSQKSGWSIYIQTVISSGQSMTLNFKSDVFYNYSGLDLTVTLVNTRTEYGINVGTVTGGSIKSDKRRAKLNDTVTLTATPKNGYVLSDLSVTNAEDKAIAVTWDIWSNTATFIMPDSAVTVTPTFINPYINMPRLGKKTFAIPACVQSFKVYDDGGKDGNYSNDCDGSLILAAPEGYVLQLSGNISIGGYYERLKVFDGSDNLAPILLNISTQNEETTAINTVTSSGRGMRIYFFSNSSWNFAGLDLTVTLVPAYDVTIDSEIIGGVVNADKANAVEGDTVTLTVTPDTGYAVKNVKVGNTKLELVEGKYSFTMPARNVTVTAEFEAKDYNIDITAPTNGSVSAIVGETVNATTAHYGDAVMLDVTPETGYVVKSVKVGDNELESVESDYSFTMPAGNVNVTAEFEAIDYNIDITEPTNGSVSAIVGENVNAATAHYGDAVMLDVTPETGYAAKSVSVNGKAITPVNGVYSFTMPAENVTVSAEFIHSNTITATSISLDGTIGVNFYCFLDSNIKKAVLTGANGDTEITDFTACKVTTGSYAGQYKLTYRVYPSQLNEKVSIKLYDAEGQGDIVLYKPSGETLAADFGYSVNDYHQVAITDEMTVEQKAHYEKLNALVAALDDLGKAADNKFNGAANTIEPIAVTADDVPEGKRLQITSGELTGFNMSLILNDATAIRIYLPDTITGGITIDNQSAAIKTRQDGKRYVELANIASNDLADMHQFKAGGIEFQFSTLSYVYMILNNETSANSTLGDCCRALLKYSQMAESYFGKES